ncbi:MAG TPA: gliding motility-associated C-terminal domain-containing protein [Flavobacteriales bacterium]|nr:gliding motility-associated C-terminal domain-containing protein [Flavobacteriales bacterium]
MTRKILFILASFITLTFSSKTQDLSITTMPSVASGCNLPCSNPITITIYNYGPFGIFVTNVDVTYTVTGPPGSTTVTETIPGLTLPAGGVYIYTFFTNATICPAGTYTIAADVNMIGDLNTTNDPLTVTITNDTTVVPGTLLGSDTVCASGNAGILTLTGNNGYIDYWEYSTDGGTTWNNIADTTNTYSYSSLTETTIYQVHIDGGYCPDDFSPWAVITVDDTTDGGFTVGAATVCATGNSGQIDLTGYVGNIVDWEYSTDGGATFTSTGIDTNFITYTNLTTTTIYQAIVQNGVCPSDFSTPTTITVTNPPVPGSVSADITVCPGTNSGSLALLGYSGTIQYWIATTDGGATFTPIANTTPIENYSGLTQTTTYYVVLQNGVCPADTSLGATVTMAVSPVADAGPDTVIYLGDTVCFTASGGFFYSWSPSVMLNNPGIQNPCIFGADSVGVFTYTLTVTDMGGCTDTDVMTVTVIDTSSTPPPTPPKIPNLFVCNFLTPNSDGDNDVWNINDIDQYPDNEVMIINNHGQILFEQKAYNNTWNGDGLPDGSYYYVVKINAIPKTYKGVLTIASSK